MALITTNRLFVDVELNRAYSQFGTFNIIPQPFFIQGDQCPVEISLVRQTGLAGSPFEQVAFDPTSTFSLKLGTTAAVATSTTTAVTPTAPAATMTNTVAYNASGWEVFKLVISPEPLGGFFTLSSSPSQTLPISVDASAIDVQSAIVGFGGVFTNSSVRVSKIGTYAWEISFNCALIGYATALSINMSSFEAYDSRVLTLDMTTAGVATLLGSNTSVEATLEFSVDTAGDVQTFLLTPCTVLNDL